MNSICRALTGALLLAAIAGCNTDESAPVDTTAPTSAVSAPSPTDATPAAPAAGASLSDEQLAAIKELPAAEQTLAMNQVVCPVGGGKLGSMGKPFKMTVKGQTVFLCCEGCEGEVESDPDAVLAKLKK